MTRCLVEAISSHLQQDKSLSSNRLPGLPSSIIPTPIQTLFPVMLIISLPRTSAHLARRLSSLVSLLILFSPLQAMAQEWSCTDRGLRQISCHEQGCEFLDRFTPMAAAFNEQDGRFSIGIYESYYQGKATSSKHGPYLLVQANSLLDRNSATANSSGTTTTDSAILTIDTLTKFGTFAWRNYYSVLRCETITRPRSNR